MENILHTESIIVIYSATDMRIYLSPSRRREAPCEGTNSPRLFTPGETKALEKSKVHQLSRAWVTNDGWSEKVISLTSEWHFVKKNFFKIGLETNLEED
jgi:hypothetical protein